MRVCMIGDKNSNMEAYAKLAIYRPDGSGLVAG